MKLQSNIYSPSSNLYRRAPQRFRWGIWVIDASEWDCLAIEEGWRELWMLSCECLMLNEKDVGIVVLRLCGFEKRFINDKCLMKVQSVRVCFGRLWVLVHVSRSDWWMLKWFVVVNSNEPMLNANSQLTTTPTTSRYFGSTKITTIDFVILNVLRERISLCTLWKNFVPLVVKIAHRMAQKLWMLSDECLMLNETSI